MPGMMTLPCGQPHAFPQAVLVLVPDVGRFERVVLAFTASITSTMSASGRSEACGPCQLPQQR